jgi:hypothetical protein
VDATDMNDTEKSQKVQFTWARILGGDFSEGKG